MNRRRTLKLSRGAKLALLAVVAVLLPTAILSVIQYRSLMELESKTKAAVQENLRQTLQSVARGVKEKLESLSREGLSAIDPVEVERENLDQVERQLTAIKQAHPEFDQVFVVVNCSCRDHNFALFATSQGVRRIERDQFKSSPEAQNVIDAHRSAHAAHTSSEKPPDFLFDRTSCVTGQETGPFQVSIFSHFGQPDAGLHFGFAGLTMNSRYIEEHLLPQTITDLLRGADAGAPDSALALSVYDENGREVYPKPGGSHHSEVKLDFGPVFRQWELGIGYRGATIEALARDQFRKSLLLTGFVLALLMLGLILTLRAATREMRLAQAKTTFVSNVSHELKTPLALIRLFAETLELGRVKSEEKAQEYYRIIHHESRRLTQLINNILDFAKIEAGRREYQFVEADVAEVVTEVLGSYEYQLMNAGCLLKTEMQPHLPPALIDRDALAQAVLNLLNNAVKYSAETKEITVRVEARASAIAIVVVDRGIGIPRAEHEKIFEKFYRVSTGLVHNTKGSGLGLALVKHIVEAHRGRIMVESAPGQGSSFTMLIPISKAAALPEQSSEAGGYRVAENPHH